MRNMLKSDAVLTLGSDSKDLNWQPLWMALLDEDDADPALDRARSSQLPAGWAAGVS